MQYLWLLIQYAAVVGGGGAALVFWLIWLQRREQDRMDKTRVTLLVTFPKGMSLDKAALLFNSLSGIKMYSDKHINRLSPHRTVVLELLARTNSLEYVVSFPPELRRQVESTLEGVISGVQHEEIAPYYHQEPWTRGVELDPAKANYDPSHDLIAPLLRSLSKLDAGTTVLAQFVLQPLLSSVMVGEEGKEEPALFRAVGRLAARGNPIKCEEVIKDVLAKYRSLKVYSLGSGPLSAISLQKVSNRQTPTVWPGYVTGKALAVSWAMPIDGPPVPGLKYNAARSLPPDNVIPEVGFIIGKSTTNAERRIALSPSDLDMHVDITGKTGTGKSSALGNLMLAQADAGMGFAFLDPHGDAIDWLLARIPNHRLDDVVFVDPGDSRASVAFNVLASARSAEGIADTVLGIFEGIYKEDRGILNANYLHGAIQALALAPGMTLIDVEQFLVDRTFRSRVMDQVPDDYVRLKYQWEEVFEALSPRERDSAVRPALNRLQPITRRDSVRRMLGQSENTLDMRKLIPEKKIVLMPVTEGLGKHTDEFIGALFFNHLWEAATSVKRAEDRVRFAVHMDEAKKFLKSNLGIEVMLDEARKYKMPLVLAHQSLTDPDMSPKTRQALNRSTRTKIAFEMDADEANYLAKIFGEPVLPTDLTGLRKREFMLKTVVDGETTVPMTVRSTESPKAHNDPEVVQALSRSRYAKPFPIIEAEIIERQTGKKRAPKGQKVNRVVGWE